METSDQSNLNISVVVTLDEGIINTPSLFIDPQSAIKWFEELITAGEQGFRNRFELESFDSYKESFYEWEDTNDCLYDKMDFEIHIWL